MKIDTLEDAQKLDAAEANRLVDQLINAIGPILYGKGHLVQGAVLGELMSIWLAGIMVTDKGTGEIDRNGTAKTRRRMLASWTKLVTSQVGDKEKDLIERMKRMGN